MKSVLFVGNSFTYFNDLPSVVKAMADARGVPLHVDSVTKGGAYLREFADAEHENGVRLREKYASQTWDAVVLQDQSFNPAGAPDDHVSAVKKLADTVFRGEALYIYQTWAYRDGSEKLRATGLSYDGMRSALREGCERSAKAVGGVRVPVGDAFGSVCANANVAIDLYVPDAYHPSPAGTYLAACVFFRFLTGQLPPRGTEPEGVGESAAEVLRRCAETV